MSNIVYLTVTGEQQGSISAGCGTSESTGNRWQSGHEDEIFTFSLLNNINNTGLGSQFHGITFCKLIDKSTPLFINSINNNEQLFMGFDFYRINRFGRLEKYYYIQLRGAFLSAIHHQIIENQLDTETITISYEFILCQHLIANTEFSYLALPENYNRLFLPNSKNQTNNRFKTLNSKAIGRLLAAGGVYNGNIEGFRDTAEKLGGDAIKGYDQILNEKTAGIAIATASILLTKRSNVDTYTEINSYLGKLRGQQKLLDGIDIIEIIYIKRPSKDLANLRKEFNKTVRKNFLIKLAKTSEASGRFNAEDLLRMRKGNVPLNYNVHHKLSLDDGGTNDFENLVLIENEPYHKVFTNMQSRIAKGILVGESKITPWAIPSGSIYPPMKKYYGPHKMMTKTQINKLIKMMNDLDYPFEAPLKESFIESIIQIEFNSNSTNCLEKLCNEVSILFKNQPDYLTFLRAMDGFEVNGLRLFSLSIPEPSVKNLFAVNEFYRNNDDFINPDLQERLVIGDYSISIFTYDIKSNFFEIRDNIGTENIFSSFSDFSSFLNEIMDSCS